jgi:hypothetical protein
MAHYAFLDKNNIVTEIIVGIDETGLIEGLHPEEWYSNFKGQVCKRTSYNNNYRKNFAGIGYTYDEKRDAFIPPKPYPSFILNEETCNWIAPKNKPELFKGQGKWDWNEEKQDYVHIDGWFAEDVLTNNPYPTDDKNYVWNYNKNEWEEIVYE